MFKNISRNKEEEVKISVKSIDEGHHQVTYRGIKAMKCPFDYVMYQMIINEVKPDLVIEVGTRFGGGSLYIADLLDTIGKGVVHAIDIVDNVVPMVKKHKRIKFFYDGWKEYDLDLVREFETILVIEDASHLYEDTIGVLKKFSPIVSNNSYLIVEDGIVSELGYENKFNGGPLKAIREFLPKNNNFMVDRKWCDMFGKNATFNVNGYLKKRTFSE